MALLQTAALVAAAVLACAEPSSPTLDTVGDHLRTVVITGPGGAAWTLNEGRRWHRLAGVEDFWAVAFANPRNGWLVGTEGGS